MITARICSLLLQLDFTCSTAADKLRFILLDLSVYSFSVWLLLLQKAEICWHIWKMSISCLLWSDQWRNFMEKYMKFHSFFAMFLYENEAPGLEQAVVVTMATRVLRPLKRAFLCIPPESLTACKIWRGVENFHFPRCLILTETCS